MCVYVCSKHMVEVACGSVCACRRLCVAQVVWVCVCFSVAGVCA